MMTRDWPPTPGSTALVLLLLLLCGAAVAHPMPAQRGTLNVVDDGAFLMISIPVGAFAGIDDDEDGRLSTDEFHRHRDRIAAAIIDEVQLLDAAGACALEGLLLSPASAHDTSAAPSTQIVAMGRFALNNPESEMTLSFSLFGESPETQQQSVSVRRSPSPQRVTFSLTPEQPAFTFLPATDS